MKLIARLVGILLMPALLISVSSYSQSGPLPVLKTGAAIPIWPGTAPGDKGNIGEEKDNTKPTDGKVAGKDVIRTGFVSKPTITVYPAPKNKSNRSAVVVCPGGGYSILAWDLEGTEICEWLNSVGVTAILLKYRVPVREGVPRYQPPLQDAQRAMGLVRANAATLGIDRDHIGIMGFSAGGHLSANISNNYEKRTYDAIDVADTTSCRPDFVMLIYPAYLTVKDQNDKVAPELALTKNTPPTFIAQTEDDPVRVENSIFYYAGLKNAGVPAEIHLFAKGGHGYGLRKSPLSINMWPQLAATWMQSLMTP